MKLTHYVKIDIRLQRRQVHNVSFKHSLDRCDSLTWRSKYETSQLSIIHLRIHVLYCQSIQIELKDLSDSVDACQTTAVSEPRERLILTFFFIIFVYEINNRKRKVKRQLSTEIIFSFTLRLLRSPISCYNITVISSVQCVLMHAHTYARTRTGNILTQKAGIYIEAILKKIFKSLCFKVTKPVQQCECNVWFWLVFVLFSWILFQH